VYAYLVSSALLLLVAALFNPPQTSDYQSATPEWDQRKSIVYLVETAVLVPLFVVGTFVLHTALAGFRESRIGLCTPAPVALTVLFLLLLRVCWLAGCVSLFYRLCIIGFNDDSGYLLLPLLGLTISMIPVLLLLRKSIEYGNDALWRPGDFGVTFGQGGAVCRDAIGLGLLHCKLIAMKQPVLLACGTATVFGLSVFSLFAWVLESLNDGPAALPWSRMLASCRELYSPTMIAVSLTPWIYWAWLTTSTVTAELCLSVLDTGEHSNAARLSEH